MCRNCVKVKRKRSELASQCLAPKTTASKLDACNFLNKPAENGIEKAWHRLFCSELATMPYSGVNPPVEPKEYNPDNKFKDPVLYFKHREAAVAEEYVKVAEAKVSMRVGWRTPQRPLETLI
jgi:hypothetical protein